MTAIKTIKSNQQRKPIVSISISNKPANNFNFNFKYKQEHAYKLTYINATVMAWWSNCYEEEDATSSYQRDCEEEIGGSQKQRRQWLVEHLSLWRTEHR